MSTLGTASGSDSIQRFSGLRSVASAPTNTAIRDICRFGEPSPVSSSVATRSKHSSTQIKRIFKKNPAKRRIAAVRKQYDESIGHEGVIPEPTIPPLVTDPKILPNGWNVPVAVDGDGHGEGRAEDHPFQVARTRNKPNNAVGFLPVYSEYRKDGARVMTRIKKVSGERGLFLNELRAALQIPIPKNPREDEIRIRNGGTIEIKGNRVLEVKTWLAGLGF